MVLKKNMNISKISSVKSCFVLLFRNQRNFLYFPHCDVRIREDKPKVAQVKTMTLYNKLENNGDFHIKQQRNRLIYIHMLCNNEESNKV